MTAASSTTCDKPGLFQRLRTFLLYAVGVPVLNLLDAIVALGSAVGTAAVFRTEQFQWSSEIEADWQSIRDEFRQLQKQDTPFPSMQEIAGDLNHLTSDEGWKTFFLFAYGHRSEANCRRCPVTANLLERVPGIQNALFSILAPGKHIPRHRGEYRGLIRCHLGLIVPSPPDRCRMQVDRETIVWRAGQLTIFDNSREHEVWNDSDETRVILLFDIVRPMRRGFAWFNRAVIRAIELSPYVKTARKNHDRWELEQKTGEHVR